MNTERNPFTGLVYDSEHQLVSTSKVTSPPSTEQTQLNVSEVLLVLLEEYSLWRGDAAVEFQLFWEACCMMTEHRLNICKYSSAPSARHLSTTAIFSVMADFCLSFRSCSMIDSWS